MVKILHPVDGSENVVRATRQLLVMLPWYKEPPTIELLAVTLPVPHFPHMGMVVSHETIERFHTEDADAMLAPSMAVLDAAGVRYTTRRRIGPIAETIVDQATQAGADLLLIGARGHTALVNMIMGSVASRVLHLASTPVLLVP